MKVLQNCSDGLEVQNYKFFVFEKGNNMIYVKSDSYTPTEDLSLQFGLSKKIGGDNFGIKHIYQITNKSSIIVYDKPECKCA